MTDEPDILDQAIDAAVALAAERTWREVSLREIAERASVDFGQLYAKTPAKPLLVLRLSQRLDRAALATAATPSDDVHDRLFDATMARVEAMEAHRTALISMARGAGAITLACTSRSPPGPSCKRPASPDAAALRRHVARWSGREPSRSGATTRARWNRTMARDRQSG